MEAHQIFPGLRHLVKNRACLWIFLGLREHEGCELFARELLLAVKQRPVQILIQADLSTIKRRENKVVTVLEIIIIERERVCGPAPAPRDPNHS